MRTLRIREKRVLFIAKNIYIWQIIKRYHLDVGASWVVAPYPGRFEVMSLDVLPNINVFWQWKQPFFLLFVTYASLRFIWATKIQNPSSSRKDTARQKFPVFLVFCLKYLKIRSICWPASKSCSCAPPYYYSVPRYVIILFSDYLPGLVLVCKEK